MEKLKKRNTGELAQSMAAHFSSLKNAIIYCIVLAIISAMPLAALIIGAMRFKECTIQPMIPIWLLVVGAVGVSGCILFITMIICRVWCCYKANSETQKYLFSGCVGCIFCLIATFYFAWMIVGSIWIFGAKPNVQFDDATSSYYCHQSVYNYSYGLVILQISIFGLLACLFYCGLIVSGCSKLCKS